MVKKLSKSEVNEWISNYIEQATKTQTIKSSPPQIVQTLLEKAKEKRAGK